MSFHPVQDLEHDVDELRRLVRALEALAGFAAAQDQRLTELVALQRGLSSNGILWSGALKVTSAGAAHKSFQAPFACLLVADLSGVGPLFVANDTVDDVLAEQAGVGRWKVPANGSQIIPLEGTELSLTSTADGICYVAAFTKAPAPVLASS